MIDINKLVSDVIEAEVSKAVARILLGPGLQESVNGHVETYLQDHPPKVSTLAASDSEELLRRIRAVEETALQNLGNHREAMMQGVASLSMQMDGLRQDVQLAHTRANAMREDMEGRDEADKLVSARIDELETDLVGLKRQLRESSNTELDSDELANTIRDMFSDGTLTISIDKV